MKSFDEELNQRLATLRDQGLYRELHRVDSPQTTHLQFDGRRLLNFASNDYLGLANDRRLKEAAARAVEDFGAGSGASRLICGSLAPFHELEAALASFKGTEAALSFSSGYTTALGTLGALLGRADIVILDKLVHACIVDAARLCSAKIRVFAHNDLQDLEDKLKWAAVARRGAPAPGQVLVVTESIFSMDGDAAPLREIIALKEKYGAWLMVDEAHATGICGPGGRGEAAALGVSGQIELQMGTLGKALGASGGFISGSHALINLLINRARSFMFSTAPVPATAAAATAAIRCVQTAEGESRRETLRARVAALQAKTGIQDARLPGAILPVLIGDEKRAVEIAMALRQRGLFVPAIRYPTVARGRARLRVTLTAAHSPEEVATLAEILQETLDARP